MNSDKHIDNLLDIPEKKTEIIINEVKTTVPATLDEDKENIKKNLYDLSDEGMSRLKKLNSIVDEIPNPQLIDSYAKLMKTIADINMNLIKLDENKSKKDSGAKTVSNTQNNFYDMSELKKKISNIN